MASRGRRNLANTSDQRPSIERKALSPEVAVIVKEAEAITLRDQAGWRLFTAIA